MRAITSSSSEREPQPFCFALRRDKEKDPHGQHPVRVLLFRYRIYPL